jgi:Protein of unknwon function (DUF3310)
MKQCLKCGQYFIFDINFESHIKICKGKKPVSNINFEDTPIKPDHYQIGGIEVFDYMRAKMTAEQFEGFCLGNVIKYISRYPHKNGLEDLQKAQRYLDELIDFKVNSHG